MKKINKLFECPMPVERALLSPFLHFHNLFSTGAEIFIEAWMFAVITIMFCFLFDFHYGFVYTGYWIFSFVSDYINPLHNIAFGKEL